MGGGGKGGGSTQVTEIPEWLRDPTIRNLERAETVQQMEYQPWTGPDVAAMTPQQQMAQQMGLGAASAFNMVPQGYGGVTAQTGMPQARTYQGGIQGYSSAPLYEQAVQEARHRDPDTEAIREILYGAPVSKRTYGGVDVAKLGGINYMDQMKKKGLL
jgi:hypothetical protein